MSEHEIARFLEFLSKGHRIGPAALRYYNRCLHETNPPPYSIHHMNALRRFLLRNPVNQLVFNELEELDVKKGHIEYLRSACVLFNRHHARSAQGVQETLAALYVQLQHMSETVKRLMRNIDNLS